MGIRNPRPWQGPLPDDPRYDPRLLRDGDTRILFDAYRYWDPRGHRCRHRHPQAPLHVAIENFGHDANIGGVVETANAFAVDTVHIVATTAELLTFAEKAELGRAAGAMTMTQPDVTAV